jgi:hypothetical protein
LSKVEKDLWATIAVVWTYTGLNAEELEGRLISSYERALTTLVDNIQHIESTIYNGLALESEVETGEGFDRRQPGHLDRHPDAAVLARGQLFGEQGVDGLDGADLTELDAAQGDVEDFQRLEWAPWGGQSG